MEAYLQQDEWDTYGSWFTWHKGWFELSQSDAGRAQIHWVHYEAILNDPEQEVRKIAELLNLGSDEELIRRVVEGSSFDSMKTAAQKAAEAGGKGSDAHLRNGKKGDWRAHFERDAQDGGKLQAMMRSAFATAFGDTRVSFDLADGETLIA